MMNHAVSGTFVPGVRENMAYFTSNERRSTVYATTPLHSISAMLSNLPIYVVLYIHLLLLYYTYHSVVKLKPTIVSYMIDLYTQGPSHKPTIIIFTGLQVMLREDKG